MIENMICIIEFLIITALLSFVGGILYYLIKDKSIYSFISKNLLTMAIVVFVIGTLVYSNGYWNGNNFSSFVCTLPGAFYSSLAMFFFNNSISDITPPTSDEAYLTCFYLINIMAIMVTMMFIVYLVAHRLISRVELHRLSRRAQKKNLYVFWRVNDSTLELARSIVARHKSDDHVVLVTTYNEQEDTHTLDAKRLFRLVKHSPQFRSLVSEDRVTSIVVDSDWAEWNAEVYRQGEFWNQSKNLNYLKQSIQKAADVHMFFMDEEEAYNINSCINILKDYTIAQRSVHIYVHARKRKSSRWMDCYEIQNDHLAHIHIVDSSRLSIDYLRCRPKYHPVRMMQIDAQTTTDSSLESLIVGFGESGKEAFQFLYEFGALVDSRDGKRNPFHCRIIDQLPIDKDRYFAERPALQPMLNPGNDKWTISMKQMDCRSETFVQEVKTYITKLNYIFITLNDDYLGLSVATHLFQLACQNQSGDYTDSLAHFKIFLRCNNVSNQLRMQQSIDQLNASLAGSKGEIVLIGKSEDIFSYQLIVDDQMVRDGKQYYDVYAAHTHDKKTWQQRRDAVKNGDLFEMENLLRKEGQDIANAQHKATKQYLLEQAVRNSQYGSLTLDDWEALSNAVHQGEMHNAHDESAIHYSACGRFKEQDINLWMTNLAKTEHLRWKAAHELLGYLFDNVATQSDKIRLKHNCLTDWETLPEISRRCWEDSWHTDYQLMDYQVVEVSMQLITNAMKHE